MISKAFFTFSLIFSLIFIASQQTRAATLCDMAEDTAGLQNCLRNRLNVAQESLNKAFTQIEGKVAGDRKAKLGELQKTWLNYRDQECMWEAGQASNESLKIINELSCMAVITENRANLLESAYAEYDVAGPREFSKTPRWANVLNKDLPSYAWDLEDTYLSDLNCDDREEIVVMGVSYDRADNVVEGDEENNAVYFEKNIAIAVIQNPDIGRPDVTNFTFPIVQGAEDKALCDKAVKFKTLESKEEIEVSENVQTCTKTLEISQSSCGNHVIINDKNGFVLEEPQEEIQSKEEKSE